MDNKGAESLELIKEDASKPQTLQVLECVRQAATSNQGSGKELKKRGRVELSAAERASKRVADQKYKTKSKEKQEEIKSQRDELEAENKLLKREMYETWRKQIDNLESENAQLKLEKRKLEGELREKDNRCLDLTREKYEAEKKLSEMGCEMKLLQANLPKPWFPELESVRPPQPQDHGTSIPRQSYTEQPKLPALERRLDTLAANDAPVGHANVHAGSDTSFRAAGTAQTQAVCENNFQAGSGTDVLLAGLSFIADFSSSPDFSPQQWSNFVQARTP